MADFIFPPEKLVADFDDFIGVWDNFFPPQMCDDVIEKCLQAKENNGWMNVDTSGAAASVDFTARASDRVPG